MRTCHARACSRRTTTLSSSKRSTSLGYPYIDGFSGTVDRRLNLAYYGLDFHRVDTTSQQVLARADSALYLHKIHGSLELASGLRA